ncbi:hypothetical protein EN784_04605 [bacterium M00.F.Ca.ET.141.01.1.1]|nr:hypothetical protein EN784_04605 [bacterium M00.F.Ca.ET.141.01.1.1]
MMDLGTLEPKWLGGRIRGRYLSLMSKSPFSKKFAYFITGWPKEYLGQVTWWHLARFISSACISVFLIYSVVAIGISGWNSLSLQRSERIQAYRQEQRIAEAARNEAARRISQDCSVPSAPTDFVAECLVRAIQSYEQDRSVSADAKAQQEMAYWADWTFKATASGVVLSLVGVVFLLWSLMQTRQAISTDREVGHAQVRAYVSALPADVKEFGEDLVPRFEFRLKNSGASPAFNLRHIAILMIHTHPVGRLTGEMIVPADGQIIPANTLASGAEVTCNGDGMKPLTKAEVDAVLADKSQRLYAFGRVFYDDVFGKSHETKFSASAIPDLGEPEIVTSEGRRGFKFSWEISPFNNEAT